MSNHPDGLNQDLVTERESVEDALRESESRYRALFDNMLNGYAYCQMIFEGDQPQDFIYLDVNAAFERLTGLKNVVGRKASEVIPGIREADSELLAVYGRVARTGLPERFETYVGAMKLWFALSVYSPAKEQFVAVFDVITDRKKAETALRESEERFRELVEGSDVAIFLAQDMKFTYLNPAALRLLGAESPKQLLGQSVLARIHPDYQEIVRKHAAKIFDGKRDGGPAHEVVYLRLDGALVPAEVSASPFTYQGQRGAAVFVQDISARKRAEQARSESEAQFRATFEQAAVGMAQADLDGCLLRVNRRFCDIVGYSREELFHKNFREITHPDDLERCLASMRQALAGEIETFTLEKRYIRKDETLVPTNVTISLSHDASGKPKQFVVVVEDITERKRAEELNSRLAMAVEQASESIVITDTHGTIIYANPAFEKTTGYTRAEALRQNPRLIKSGQQNADFYRRMWDSLKRGEIWNGHFVNRRKDGALYEEEATISPVRDTTGQVVNYVAVKRDVTHEVQLQAQFRQAQKMEAIGQLAGGVAHDFNNILGAMLMQAELAEAGENLPEATRECLREIRAYTERAANLTRQLLLFSRREVMQLRDLDLNESVTNLAKMLQRMIGEDVSLQLHLHPGPLMARADAGMIDQVLMNLAVNARDAMPHGGRLLIETTVKAVDESVARPNSDAAPGDYVCLMVSDTGCGIPPEVLPRIFEPFFTTKEPGKGTGLGLATVFGIVKQHKGWLDVHNKPGQGATFQIFLPARPATDLNLPEAVTTQPKPAGGTETILLVEDEWALRTLTRVILKRNGYKVLEAPNGVQALKVWQENTGAVTLLLTDLVMPAGLTGFELARQLRAEQPRLKVIFTSGYSSEIAGHHLQLSCGERFIQKPCAPDKLLGAIRQCLDEGEKEN